MTPLQLECITAMREGWRLSADLVLRAPSSSRDANRYVRRQTINALHRRGLVENDKRNGYWILTEDGKQGPLL